MGPDNVVFDFGPAPMSAVRARLTTSRYASIVVATRLLPSEYGLPHARYFIARLPGPDKYWWKVTLLDAAGHKGAIPLLLKLPLRSAATKHRTVTTN
jgi:hypothetical protein